MSKTLTIYHGSQHIIEAPVYGAGRRNNDFGVGFIVPKAKTSLRNGPFPLFGTVFAADTLWMRSISRFCN